MKYSTAEKIKEVLEKILPQFPVDFAYLYGSQAKGTTYAESDIDLALAFSAETKGQEEDVLLEIYPAINHVLPIPTEKLDLQNFHALPLRVRFRVIREGKPLYIKNLSAHRQSVIYTMSRYHDEKPFFQKAIQAFLERAAS